MTRKLTYRTNKFPYHIVSRSNQKNWFRLPMGKAWEISKEVLSIAHKKHLVNIHAFVLMSNHYHLVLDTPDANIDDFMYEFNKNFSLRMRVATKNINKMFGGRYKWSVIKDRNYYMNVMKYVFLNPVKAKICLNVQDYKYTSIIYQRLGPITLKPYINLMDERILSWLNISHSSEQSSSITRGLQRKEFRFTGTREARTPPSFDSPTSQG